MIVHVSMSVHKAILSSVLVSLNGVEQFFIGEAMHTDHSPRGGQRGGGGVVTYSVGRTWGTGIVCSVVHVELSASWVVGVSRS